MTWSFSARCPKGHHVTQEGFAREVLRQRLAKGEAIRLYCSHCNESWDADEAQRRLIEWTLANAPAL